MSRITRFAPSPTGLMHVGNAFSALICQQWAEQHHARLLLRIEDIDFNRCREEYMDAIIEDLRWLKVGWHGDVRRQSEHIPDYQQALRHLRDMGMIYPCFCTRRQIQKEISRMGMAPHTEDAIDLYPGTCRKLPEEHRRKRMSLQHYAWRLNFAEALKHAGKKLAWKDDEGCCHSVRAGMHGDTVIGRKDIGISYHLAVVVDDAAQGVTHIIRGEDLLPVTGLHRLLQALLNLPSPIYIHHPLLRDASGNRLAKRHGAPSLQQLRNSGIKAADLRRMLLHSADHIWHGASTWQGE